MSKKQGRANLPMAEQHSDYRALTLFEDLPPAHKAVLVLQTGFEPHLKVGEFAVVDTTDKEVLNGELYMIWNNSSLNGPQLSIVQASMREYRGSDGPFTALGWRYAFLRPGGMPFGEGPYCLEGWKSEKCFGRVVGIYQPMQTNRDLGDAYVPLSILD
jgi:hypothetical protein